MSGGDLFCPAGFFSPFSLMGGGLLVLGSGWVGSKKPLVVGRDGWCVERGAERARRLVSSFNVRSRRGKKSLLVLFSFVAASK